MILRRIASRTAVGLAVMMPLLAVLPARASAPPAAAEPGDYRVERLAPAVYAVVRTEPEALAVNANSLIVIRAHDVVVVDAQFTRQATLEVLHEIRRLTPKPVAFVVNTHWHDDHMAGNQVYRDTFPGVRFVAQANTRADFLSLGRDNRKGTLGAGPKILAGFQEMLDHGMSLDSTPLTPSSRAAIESTLRIANRYIEEAPGFRETPPDSTFADSLTLADDSVPVKLYYYGPANTRGDAVVWLPRQRVVATGDILVAPIPFTFGSHISSWIGVLKRLDGLGAAAIMPGHGPVMHDDSYIRQLSTMLTAVHDSVGQEVKDGATLAQVHQRVRLAALRRQVAGGDAWLDYIFELFFLNPAIERVHAEASNGSAAAPGQTDPALRRAIDEGNAQYIRGFARRQADTVAAVYAPDGARLGDGGQVAQGRAAIAADVAGLIKAVGPVTVELKTVEIWQVGRTAYETGNWSYAFTPPGKQPQKIGGKYVTVWAQQPDGSWRIQGDIGVPGT